MKSAMRTAWLPFLCLFWLSLAAAAAPLWYSTWLVVFLLRFARVIVKG